MPASAARGLRLLLLQEAWVGARTAIRRYVCRVLDILCHEAQVERGGGGVDHVGPDGVPLDAAQERH
eukprot:COSAG06_NODE_14986_length_1108_cov_19.817641_1_plen_66_part_10